MWPPELADHICSLVDEPGDLLAIALVSRFFRDIAIPKHLHYCYVSGGLNQLGFWRHLLGKKHSLSRVKVLEIVTIPTPEMTWIPKRHEIPPQFLDHELIEHPEIQSISGVLAQIIRCMPRLKRFRWTTASSFTSEIFTALAETSTDIQEVEILNNETVLCLKDSKLWSLSNLTSFSWTEYHVYLDEDTHAKYLQQMADMLLHHCSALESLQLFFNVALEDPLEVDSPRLNIMKDLFANAAWSELKRLTVQGSYISSDFFRRHSKIEALSISYHLYERINLDDLPKLRSLEVGIIGEPENILISTNGKNLQHLTLWLSSNSPSILSPNGWLYVALSTATNLQSLVINSESPLRIMKSLLTEILTLVPVLRRLDLRADFRTGMFTSMDDTQVVADLLHLLPNLTHYGTLYSPFPASPVGKGQKNQDRSSILDDTIKEHASIVPRLSFVGITELNSRQAFLDWVVIQKVGGEYAGFREVKGGKYRKDIDPDLWGDTYYGAYKNVRRFWIQPM